MKNALSVGCALAAVAAWAGPARGGLVRSWTSPIDGIWSTPANWTPMDAPDTLAESAHLGLAGPYTVTLAAGVAIDSLIIDNPDAVLGVNGAQTLSLAGPLKNNGEVFVNAAFNSFNASLAFTSPTEISGTGVITLQRGTSDPADAALNAGPGLIHDEDHVIQGSGQILGSLENRGTILANDPNQPIEIRADIDQTNDGAIIAVDFGAFVLADGASISGGLVDTITGGEVIVNDGALDGVEHFQTGIMGVAAGGSLELGPGGMTNDGLLVINDSGGAFNAEMAVPQSAVIDASDPVVALLVLNQQGGDPNDAVLSIAPGATLTSTGTHEIRGSGRITGGGVLANDNLITAQSLDVPLRIDVAIIQQSPDAEIRADGGLVLLEDDGAVFDGVIASTGDGVVSSDGGEVGGAVNLGAMAVENGGSLLISEDGLVNHGSLVVNRQGGAFNTVLELSEPTIEGDGSITLNQVGGDPNDAQIVILDGTELMHTGDHEINGAGRITGDIDNDARIVATNPAQPLRLANGVIDQTPLAIVRGENALLRLEPGAVLRGGVIQSFGDGAVSAGGDASAVDGVTVFAGSVLGVENGGTLEIRGGGVNNMGAIVVNRQEGAFNTTLVSTETAAISGHGEIILNPTSNDLGDAQIGAVPGASLTLGPNQTVTGTGRLTGDLIVEGVLRPRGLNGSAMEIVGDTVLADDAVIDVRYFPSQGGSPLVSGFIGAGSITLGGVLGFTPDGLDPLPLLAFDLIDGPLVNGVFTQFDDSNLPEPFMIRLSYFSPTRVSMQITCMGDLTSDAEIDSVDLNVLLSGFGTAVPPRTGGDVDGDGLVDSIDLNLLLSAFGQDCADLLP